MMFPPPRDRLRFGVFDALEARQLCTAPSTLTGQLDPASDSGVSRADAVTNDTTPRFFGQSTPGSTVAVFANPVGTSIPVPIGRTTTDSLGDWNLTSIPLAVGTYNVEAVATSPDGASSRSDVLLPNPLQGPLVIDTQAPKVAFVQFEPLTGRVLVSFQDDSSGLDQASVVNTANYGLTEVGSFPKIPPKPVRPGFALAPEFLTTGVATSPTLSTTSPQTVIVSVDNNQGLPGGSYRITIHSGGIEDNAGNALDGTYVGVFPSGTGHPGGDFVANLNVIKNTVLPAQPLHQLPPKPGNPGMVPTKVFVPTTRQTRIKLVGYNKGTPAELITKVVPLPGQFFPGTYEPPKSIPGPRK